MQFNGLNRYFKKYLEITKTDLKKITMIRTFHPVGQGAFYTEEFENFSIVYDCGSSTGNNTLIIEKAVRSTFSEDQVLDAVFISHLHMDHVNGLEFLLKHCNVRKLFLPLLSQNSKLNLFIQNSILGYQSLFIEKLIFGNIDSILQEFENLEIIYIPEITEENLENNFDSDPISIDDAKIADKIQQKSKLMSSQASNWVFIPFNFKAAQRSLELTTKLENLQKSPENISIETVEDFTKHWLIESDRNKIIDTYKSVTGSMNTNSMTLYSGPNNGNNLEFYMNLIHPSNKFVGYCFDINIVGCIYFGDYVASGLHKWNQFKNFYGSYWDCVSTVQIPHHGSRHNYHPDINLLPKFSIISAGYKNKYHHPHSSTIKQILFYGGSPIVVNEYPGSFIVFEIYTYSLLNLRHFKIRKLKKLIANNS